MLGFSLSKRAWLRVLGLLVAAAAYLLQAHRSLSSRAVSYVKPGHWAVVLGGSEGLGEAWAYQLGHLDMNLIVVARREKPLEDVRKTIHEKKPDLKVELYKRDLARLNESSFSEMLEGRDVRVMIYNAAYAGTAGRFLEADAGDFLSSIDVNVKGVAAATHAFGKQLKARGVPGGVVLMSSMVGEIGSAFVANYAATKAYITTLAEGLYDEWWSQGLDALACVAGATITPTYLSSFSVPWRRVAALPRPTAGAGGGAQRAPAAEVKMDVDKKLRTWLLASLRMEQGLRTGLLDTGARVSWIEQEPFEVVSECLANLGRTSAVATGALNKVILLIFTRLLPRTVATQIFGHQTSKMLGIA
ncbi:unnamed protein product [Durusdinium trenchii]|uniref:Uncharacterized protein n=1 Tax=Durusdinium trenchii TaxID=1381693 RepID=A0ABP0P2G4_9DINO